MPHHWFSESLGYQPNHYAVLHLEQKLHEKISSSPRTYPQPKDFLDFISLHYQRGPSLTGAGGCLVYGDVEGTADHKALMAQHDQEKRLAFEDLPEDQRKVHDDLARLCRVKKISPTGFSDVYAFCGLLQYLIKLESKEEKSQHLAVFSAEATKSHPRKPILLLAHINDYQHFPPSTGYVAAYDIIEDRVIVQKYISTAENGPLDFPWIKEMPAEDDGITFFGTPEEYLDRIIGAEGVDKNAPDYGFNLSVRVLVGEAVRAQILPPVYPPSNYSDNYFHETSADRAVDVTDDASNDGAKDTPEDAAESTSKDAAKDTYKDAAEDTSKDAPEIDAENASGDAAGDEVHDEDDDFSDGSLNHPPNPFMDAIFEIEAELRTIPFPKLDYLEKYRAAEKDEEWGNSRFWGRADITFQAEFERQFQWHAQKLWEQGKKDEATKVAETFDELSGKLEKLAVDAKAYTRIKPQ